MAALVGIDLGSAHARAVVLRPTRSGWRLTSTACVPTHEDDGERKPLRRLLAELDSRVSLRGTVTVSASELTTMVRFERNDPMPEDRLRKVLHLELSQHGGGEEDLCADAVTLPIEGDQVVHCCGLAQPPQVQTLLAGLRKAHVDCRLIDLPPAALARVMILEPPTVTPDEEVITGRYRLLVDLGAECTRLALVRDAEFLGCRQLPMGGQQFTAALAQARRLTPADAERVKCRVPVTETMVALDSALAVGREVEADDAAGFQTPNPPAPAVAPTKAALQIDDGPDDGLRLDDTGSDQPAPPPAAASADKAGDTGDTLLLDDDDEALPAVVPVEPRKGLHPDLRRSAAELFTQIHKTTQWFQSQLKLKQLPLAEIRLYGGGAALEGLAEHLAGQFKVPVVVGNPCAALQTRRPVEDPQVWALAIGTALAPVCPASCFDLRPESLLRRRMLFAEVAPPYLTTAFLAAAIVCTALALSYRQGIQAVDLQRLERQKEEHKRLTDEIGRLLQQRQSLKTDMLAIASRIYGGRTLLYAIRNFKSNERDDLWIYDFQTTNLTTGRTLAKPATGGAGRAALGETATPPPAASKTRSLETVVDTAIDRGQVILKGFVTRNVDEGSVETNRRYAEWQQQVQTWNLPDSNQPIFGKADPKIDIGDATQRKFGFTVTFAFQPTQLKAVVGSRNP